MLPETSAELNLIVKAGSEHDDLGPRLSLNDCIWTLKATSDFQTSSKEVIEYMCVSYIWGASRVPNPLTVGPKYVSTNTLPALSAAMRNTDIKAFWIDAFCVPSAQPARAATLESMGYIYNRAKEVRAVLETSAFLAVKQLSVGDRLDAEAFLALEADKWVQSAWTYQEVVNSQQLAFVCSDAPGSIVDGSHFLNGVGYSISEYKKEHNINAFSFRKKFPSLDALEELVSNWMIAGYQERSALAVMSNMDSRKWTEEQNYFYSMIGAITSELCRRSDIGQKNLAETFMKICEAKNDFSFIYSSSLRSTDTARRWRPLAGLLPSVLPWHCSGESQPGHFDESGSLCLEKILVFRKSHLSKEAKDYIAQWLHDEYSKGVGDKDIGELMYSALVGMGFTGDEIVVTLTHGMFFPQTSLSADSAANARVLVSGTIRWTFGAPGIALYTDEEGATCFIPGVFAGIVDEKSTTSVRLI